MLERWLYQLLIHQKKYAHMYKNLLEFIDIEDCSYIIPLHPFNWPRLYIYE